MPCFDSILVRLKGYHLPLVGDARQSFDSILVRLKVDVAYQGIYEVEVSIPYWFD